VFGNPAKCTNDARPNRIRLYDFWLGNSHLDPRSFNLPLEKHFLSVF